MSPESGPTGGATPLSPHDHVGTCWWCGSPAADGTFCADCNGPRSAVSDDAFHALIAWFLANEQEVETKGTLRLDAVYPDWKEGRRQLIRYFVEHVGCRIADAGYTVPPSINACLDGKAPATGLALAFEVNSLHAELNSVARAAAGNKARIESIMLGPITGGVTAEHAAVTLRGWWGYRGLQLTWEWSLARPDFWTNLDAATVTLPMVQAEEAESMRKVRLAAGAMGLASRTRDKMRRKGDADGEEPEPDAS